MKSSLVGPGRAGMSMRRALETVGWSFTKTLGRDDALDRAGEDVDVVFVAVPDNAISSVAAAIKPCEAAVIHLSGATKLDALAPHRRTGSVHPLASLPNPETGAKTLLNGATFAVAGDRITSDIVTALGGTAIDIPDELRSTYHAAATVASNHLVALCGQVDRLAAKAGVPAGAYWDLMAASLDNVRRAGPAAALTGPAARGDWATLASHLDAIGPTEAALYRALSVTAAELAGQQPPPADPPIGSPNEEPTAAPE